MMKDDRYHMYEVHSMVKIRHLQRCRLPIIVVIRRRKNARKKGGKSFGSRVRFTMAGQDYVPTSTQS
jgi:hypothetical protein